MYKKFLLQALFITHAYSTWYLVAAILPIKWCSYNFPAFLLLQATLWKVWKCWCCRFYDLCWKMAKWTRKLQQREGKVCTFLLSDFFDWQCFHSPGSTSEQWKFAWLTFSISAPWATLSMSKSLNRRLGGKDSWMQ